MLRPEGLTIALVHTLFNLTAITLVYPVRKIREFPVRLAEAMANLAVKRQPLAIAYSFGLFVAIPLVGLFALN